MTAATWTDTDTPRDPAWRGRLMWGAAALLLLWPTLLLTEFRPWTLLHPSSLQASLRFVTDALPPRLDLPFLQLVLREAWATVAMATAGIALALVGAVPLTLLTVRTLSISGLSGRMAPLSATLRASARGVLVLLRSVPELIWALMLVRVVGLGPTAGVLAIALTYIGMLGKVYGEILESGDAHATQTLLRNGAGRLQALLYGLLPQNAAELTSYTIYRWECALRSSAVLGLVGAGGLGQQIDTSMKMFNGAEVLTMLMALMALVWAADRLSAWLREAMG